MLLRSFYVAPPLVPWPSSDWSRLCLQPIRIRLHLVQPVNSRTNVGGGIVVGQTMIGLRSQLHLRQQLQCGQRFWSFPLVHGAGAQDAGAIAHPKSTSPVYPSIFVLSSSRGRRSSGEIVLSSSRGRRSSGEIECSSHLSVWKRSASSANASVASGGTRTDEQLWEEYFADTSQWWDNRVGKKSPRSPDLEHKVRKEALWIDRWSTPAWVKARLTSVAEGRLRRHGGPDTRGRTCAQGRLLKSSDGDGNTLLTGARESRQFVQDRGGSMHVRSARTAREAIDILKNRLQQGISTDMYTYCEVLKRCLKQNDSVAVKQVHDCIIKSDMDHITFVANNLLSAYVRCKRLQDARRVFDGLVKKDVVSWNVMIGGYAQQNHASDAMELFHKMCRDNVEADAITYLSVLKACVSPTALKWGEEVHARIRHAGIESDVRVGTALLKMYATCGSIKQARQAFDKLTNRDVFSWNVMIGAYVKTGSMDDARLVFDRMGTRDVISWTVMIGGYAESGLGEKAYELFLEMKREGLRPDAATFMSILNGCASVGALEWVKAVHGHALEVGLESDMRVSNALIHMYAKCGSLGDARLVFDNMRQRDVVSWTGMIGGLAQHGYGHEALEAFRNMIGEGVKPDEKSFVAVLAACSHAGLLDDGRQLFLAMTQDYGMKPDVFVCNCMVDMLGRAGYLEEAMQFISDMPVKADEAIWGALLGACRIHGNVELAELAAKERLKLEPNHAGTYVLLSNIYAAAGEWDQVSLVRTMMQERGIRKEPGRSWIEVDNKVHYFVVGDTSHPEAKEIYAELNRLTESIKAEGYTPDTRLVLQNIDEEDKELALCSHSEKLAIAYGLMRTPRGEPIRVYKNLRVCSDCHTATKFISKVTGREIVARDANRFHYFKDGVCSCGDFW